MRINQHTKISALIKANELSIDAIASIAKPLRKIKIPLLRKFLTPRVNILEASKIAGVTVMDFRRVLEPLGFVWEEEIAEDDALLDPAERPEWLLKAKHLDTMDVRPMLEEDKDPLKEIFQAYKVLPEQGVLHIINSFVPYPLIKRLEDRGALSYTESIREEEYHSYFYKAKVLNAKPAEAEAVTFVSLEEFTDLLESRDQEQLVELDVRDLPMPQPMDLIISTLSEMEPLEWLYIQHKKVPLHLLEELESLNFRIFLCEVNQADVRIIIYPQE